MAYKILDHKGKAIQKDGVDVLGMDTAGAVKSVDVDKRILTITGSTENRDRDMDIIRVKGWVLEPYLKNPVVLWGHDYRSVPIGASTKLTRKRNPSRLDFTIRFPSLGLYQFSDMILALFGERIINASSVGFMPIKWNELPAEKDDSDDSRPEWYRQGREFVKQELLELSAVPVPSNREALQNSIKEYGGFDTRQKDLLLQLMVENERPPNAADIEEEIYNFAKSLEVEDEEREAQVQVPPPPSSEDLCKLEEEEEEGDSGEVKVLCTCLDCGHKVKTSKHCTEITCPKCGGEMRREERPGPGRGKEEEEDASIPVEDLPEGKDFNEIEERPYPNEHSCRLLEPRGFDSYRRVDCAQKQNDKCIDVIYGIKDGKAKIQALRFKKDTWTVASARSVCRARDGTFEPAGNASIDESTMPSLEILQELYRAIEAIGGLDILRAYREEHLEVKKRIVGKSDLEIVEKIDDLRDKDKMADVPLPPDCFVWSDGGDSENSKLLQFASLDKSGEKVVACQEMIERCMSELNGAFNGVDIPDRDRQYAYLFLCEYYERMKETPPQLMTFHQYVVENNKLLSDLVAEMEDEKGVSSQPVVVAIEDAVEIIDQKLQERVDSRKWEEIWDKKKESKQSVSATPKEESQDTNKSNNLKSRSGLNEQDIREATKALRALLNKLGEIK